MKANTGLVMFFFQLSSLAVNFQTSYIHLCPRFYKNGIEFKLLRHKKGKIHLLASQFLSNY